jgi:endonuclease YncB( thermonuclease family)
MSRRHAITLAVLPWVLYILTGEAMAEIYRWVDRAGQLHFSDDANLVPPEYRDQVQVRPSTPSSEAPSQALIINGGGKVRYTGLNTPETHHPDKLPEYCGQEAFEANRRLVAGKTVRLEFDERRRDRYGRLLAYVYVGNLFVNAELIRQGYAQVSTYKENRRYHEDFTRLQRSAIEARRGLWGGCSDRRLPPTSTTP